MLPIYYLTATSNADNDSHLLIKLVTGYVNLNDYDNYNYDHYLLFVLNI